jgi:phosphate transport system substrate-binding protein
MFFVACTATPAAAPTPLPADVTGQIDSDGSSTVGPITMRVAQAFQGDYPNITVATAISGTGGGFRTFCAGETDISNASRPINGEESDLCQQNNIEFVELPIAFDGIAVVVHPENQFVSCLTAEELKALWQPAAERAVTHWQQLRPDFPDEPIALFGPGLDSGTYDYFTQAIVGSEGESRTDFFPSEDDNVLVDGIAADTNALGFFGYSYYDENRDRLKLVAVDSGNGCVEPNTETVARGLYQPLSRPLFIYINHAHIQSKDEISAFVSFYLAHAPSLVDDVGYIPLTDQLYQLAQARYNQRTTGSVFEGLGSTVGVSLADLLAREQQ